jgi:hypothetical protein
MPSENRIHPLDSAVMGLKAEMLWLRLEILPSAA